MCLQALQVYRKRQNLLKLYGRDRKMRGNWGLLIAIIFMVCVGTVGCLGNLFSVESPRPLEYQVTASKEITTSTVEQVMKGQLGKQEGIEAVALKALEVIKHADGVQVEGITNVVANTANEIRRADGSAKLLSSLSGESSKGIAEMSALEYMTYAGAQTALAMQNREQLAQGIKAGWQWTKSQIGVLAGGVTGGGSWLALALGLFGKTKTVKSKDTTLKVTGNVINKFAAENPEAGKRLKAMMAEATSGLPINARTEFGIG